MSTPTSKRLVNVSFAAEYADVHPGTVRRWIAAGHYGKGRDDSPRQQSREIREARKSLVCGIRQMTEFV